MELIEIVGRIDDLFRLEAKPAHVLLDRLDKPLVLGLGVRVIETQHRRAAELVGHTEVEADRLGVPNMQKTIRLRWETCLDATAVGARRAVLLEHLADEVGARVGGRALAVVARGRVHVTNPTGNRGERQPHP